MANYVRVAVNFGTAPTGAGGDNNRAGIQKVDADLAQVFSSFTLDSTSGFVGLGTTPDDVLHVFSSTDPALKLESGDSSRVAMRFQNTTTGTTDSNGLFVGISATEVATFFNFENTNMEFGTNNSTFMILDTVGNILIGGTTAGTASAGNINLFNGTAPTAGPVNGTILYSEDVSASSELKVMDEANNITVLSPHNFSQIPEGPSEDMAWSYYSERDGKGISVDMLKAIRILEQLSGQQLVHEFTK